MDTHALVESWKTTQEARQQASTRARTLGKDLKEIEQNLLEAMAREGMVDEVDLGDGRVLRVNRLLKESKKESADDA